MALRGRWALAADEDFRLIFRRTDRGRAFALYVVGSLVVVVGTLLLLLSEPFDAGAWIAAFCVDVILIAVLRYVRRVLTPGPLILDASEARLFFPGGSDLALSALKGIRIRRAGPLAELSLVLDIDELRLGTRAAPEVERAAAAVARLTGLPVQEAA